MDKTTETRPEPETTGTSTTPARPTEPSGIEQHSHAGSTGFSGGQISPKTQGEPSVGNGTHRPGEEGASH